MSTTDQQTLAADLAHFTDWTEETIAKRQADLARAAKTVWSLAI